MTIINTNTSSLVARDAIQRNDRAMSTAMEQLSTGSRINTAKDDAAGLAINERMAKQVSGLNMAVRNTNDAISLLQTAEGAGREITNMLSRMRELAVQAASGTYTATDRTALNLEYQALLSEIDSIATNTEWNGDKILGGADSTVTTNLADSKSLSIQVGAEANQSVAFTLNSWISTVAVDGSMTAADGTGKSGVDDQDPEVSLLTFTDYDIVASATATITIAGLTAKIVNGTGSTITLTDDAQADIFANLEDGDTAGVAAAVDTGLTNATFTGTLDGFQSSGVINDNTLNFTSVGTTTSNNTGNVATIGTPTMTQSSGLTPTAPAITSTSGGSKANQSAYGSGVLYFGGNVAKGGGTALAPTALNITTAANAASVVTELEAAINGAAAERAKYGAYVSRLQHAADNLANVSTNTAASRSRIADADYAAETTELARTQIISQASTAMLAQANQVKQTVLSLLQ